MEASSSSKVTVAYHDPAGIFPLVSRDIAARLPLRNLNWQTPSRPLRQIKQLYVEFVPDSLTEAALRPPVHRFDSNGPTSLDIVRSGSRKDGAKERRHQIPGLKTSPYLRVYVLRCDDKEQYRDTERKRIRAWIRENAPSTDKRGGEDHDACEWLILHVVVPETVAASEPRWRESQSDPDTLKERKTSGVKFPGKSTRTVFDRVRADFNESGKGAQDRVAQIRLLKNDVPPDLLPTPAVAETLAETPQERENAWKDLVDKLKVLILGPFDARVRQYEADVAAQESRRSLPGWNFCTFFIHKEGLAKALESVGLAEDALVIYDELSVGLETVLRDIASGQAEGTATTFAPYTSDIEARILGKMKTTANGTNDEENHEAGNSGLFAKNYREQIVRSNISAFDFFCYLFTRQKAIILRLANTRAARAELGGDTKDGGEDLVLTSEVCWRASSFIHDNARALRQDLSNAPNSWSHADIEALVCSWTHAVAEQVLSETAAPVLALVQSSSDDNTSKPLHGNPLSPKREDFAFGLGADPYPQRTSSLGLRKSAPELQRPPSMSLESTMSPPSSSGTDLAGVPKGAGIPGLPELATYRAELVMIQRNVLELLAERRGWVTGWASIRRARTKQLEEIDLEEEERKDNKNENSPGKPAISNLIGADLLSSLQSENTFHSAYERLGDRAMRYYALATQTKSVESILSGLAILKRQQGDIASTEEYIRHILPTAEAERWSTMQAELMSVYIGCLKELGKKEEYVNFGLDLVGKALGRRMDRRASHFRDPPPSDDEDFKVPGMLSDLVARSESLAQDITRPAEHYFGEIKLEGEIMHREDRDGFALHLHFRYLLESDDIQFDQVSARLVNVDDSSQEIWLTSTGASRLQPGMNEVELESTTVTLGAYLIDKIILQAKKLRFVLELHPRTEPTLKINDVELPESLEAQSTTATAPRQPSVFVYPAEHAFNAEINPAKSIYINRHRFLDIAISTGRNEIQSVEMKLKPTSAGLRLHLADAKLDGVEKRSDAAGVPGALCLGSMAAHTTAIARIPYSVEQAIRDVSVRLEAQYRTSSKGSFVFLSSATLRHELPLDVDVDDIFHLDTLFSHFTIRATNRVPLTILHAELGESAAYTVQAPPLPEGETMTIFERSPAKLLYQITRRPDSGVVNKKDAALALGVHYVSLDDLLVAMIRERFTAGLQDCGIHSLGRLLLPLIIKRSRDIFTPGDLEMAVLLGQAKMPSYEDFGWKDVVKTLSKAVQPALTEWLKKWHDTHRYIPIDYGTAVGREASRRIMIAVDVPTIDVVFNASLLLTEHETVVPAASPQPITTRGAPLRAQLAVTHTDSWSARHIFGTDKAKLDHAKAFVCDIQSDPETWLIGGPRRMHFTPAVDEDLVVDLLLIPLKLGSHHLPTVDVQPGVEVEGETERPGGPAAISCETHYESGGDIVRVVRDARTTEVRIVESSETMPPSRPSTASRGAPEPG